MKIKWKQSKGKKSGTIYLSSQFLQTTISPPLTDRSTRWCGIDQRRIIVIIIANHRCQHRHHRHQHHQHHHSLPVCCQSIVGNIWLILLNFILCSSILLALIFCIIYVSSKKKKTWIFLGVVNKSFSIWRNFNMTIRLISDDKVKNEKKRVKFKFYDNVTLKRKSGAKICRIFLCFISFSFFLAL